MRALALLLRALRRPHPAGRDSELGEEAPDFRSGEGRRLVNSLEFAPVHRVALVATLVGDAAVVTDRLRIVHAAAVPFGKLVAGCAAVRDVDRRVVRAV